MRVKVSPPPSLSRQHPGIYLTGEKTSAPRDTSKSFSSRRQKKLTAAKRALAMRFHNANIALLTNFANFRYPSHAREEALFSIYIAF